MHLLFSRPDRYFARCGHLDATVVERHIDGTPGFMRGLRVMFVSDTHVLRRTARADLDALANRIAACSPDLVLLGGDYADRADEAVRLFEALAILKPPLGVYAVLGNNDAEAWEGRLDELRGTMSRAGIHLLLNQRARLRHNGGTILVAGLDEYHYGAPQATGLFPAKPKQGVYRVLLSHYPKKPDLAPDLMLCGHTHGGQFNLLGLTPFSIGFERVWPRIPAMAVSGLLQMGDMKLLVSKGIGASRLQLRIGVRPEIDLLVFD